MESQNILYYGSPEPLPSSRPLQAGPLTLDYENGDLRGIRLGEREIVKRIYMAVRDRDWGTVRNEISGEAVEAGEDWFRISYHSENRRDEIHFSWDAVITGTSEGTIQFSFDGLAVTSFLQSRIGLCILHPMLECAGQSCRVERADGPVRTGIFPVYITSAQPLEPFAEMTALSYPAGEDTTVELRFTGDVFEMEDQRNWTDASYKTFCTPLRLGSPRPIESGARVNQSVTLQLSGRRPHAGSKAPARQIISISVDHSAATPLPRVGLCAPSHGTPATERELNRLRALNLSHLRVDVRPSEPGWRDRLQRVIPEARSLGIPIEVALHLSGKAGAELDEVAATLRNARASVSRWMVFHVEEIVPSDSWIALARERLGASQGGALIGSGTDADFAEINSRRPAHNGSGFLTYSLNPQTHAFDNASLIETLPVQALTARTARLFAGRRPILIGPINLKMRFNPYALAPPVTGPGILPPQVDPRQMSLFCAGWTLGSVKYLAEGGEVEGITYYETTGWRGVMETEQGSPPELFPSTPGTVFPVYHVFAALAGFTGGEVLQTRSSLPTGVDALTLRKSGSMRMLVANVSPTAHQVRLGDFDRGYCKFLDETSMPAALQKPEEFWSRPGAILQQPWLEIMPFGLAILDTR